MASDLARGDRFDPALVARLATLIEGPARPVVLIDGGSGAGKSSLADQVAKAIRAQLIRLENVYPGWDGLEAASAAVSRDILAPGNPGWRSWDWASGEPGQWHPIDPSKALLIEGSGSLSRRNRELATFGIWLQLDKETRRSRALARDGDLYAPHWEHWAAQEQQFFDRERPDLFADVVIAGPNRAVEIAGRGC